MKELFITVNFHEARTDDFTSDDYHYWIHTDKDVHVGDYLILKDESNWNCLKVVRVKSLEKHKLTKHYDKALTKALIGFADVSDYFAEKEKRQRAKELKEKMEKRFKEVEKMSLYAKLAETDSEMKALYDEYNSLNIKEEGE